VVFTQRHVFQHQAVKAAVQEAQLASSTRRAWHAAVGAAASNCPFNLPGIKKENRPTISAASC